MRSPLDVRVSQTSYVCMLYYYGCACSTVDIDGYYSVIDWWGWLNTCLDVVLICIYIYICGLTAFMS